MLIHLKSVAKTFGSNEVLKDISFQVKPGERVSLTGPGGCGKTLILKILLGLLEADSGEVYLMDQNMTTMTSQEREEVMKKTGVAFLYREGVFEITRKVISKVFLFLVLEICGSLKRLKKVQSLKSLPAVGVQKFNCPSQLPTLTAHLLTANDVP